MNGPNAASLGQRRLKRPAKYRLPPDAFSGLFCFCIDISVSPLLLLVHLICFPLPTVVFVSATMFSAAARIASRTAVRAATNTSALSALRPAVAQPFVVRTFAASVSSACNLVGCSGMWSFYRASCM